MIGLSNYDSAYGKSQRENESYTVAYTYWKEIVLTAY